MLRRVFVANRSEIALRIIRTATDLGVETVAIFSEDDRASPHVAAADTAVALEGVGPPAYLDPERLAHLAVKAGCDAVHPGYGLLSEDPRFAHACEGAGLTFVGPSSETLRLLADKRSALDRATALGVPVLPRSERLGDVDAAEAFFRSLGQPIMLKATQGGGGRGLRIVEHLADLPTAFRDCQAEATRAFGAGDLYAEQLLASARHIEVQIVGDGTHCLHLHERDCSLQRRRQKLVEIAPAPRLEPAVRDALFEASLALAQSTAYRSLGTFEFLVAPSGAWYFMECNPRLQVEHTVTEEVTGLDLVALQLQIAGGATLPGLGLRAPPPPRGRAIQLRVNAEVVTTDGQTVPADGTLQRFTPPSGPGIRVDAAPVIGQSLNPRFDSLLAKVIVRVPQDDLEATVRRARRALSELRVEGMQTNASLLSDLLASSAVLDWSVSTRFVETSGLLTAAAARSVAARGAQVTHTTAAEKPGDTALTAAGGERLTAQSAGEGPAGHAALVAPLRAEVVAVLANVGDRVTSGQEIVVLEAMKMHHVVAAPASGQVVTAKVAEKDIVTAGQLLVTIAADDEDRQETTETTALDLDAIRPDLEALQDRLDRTLDHRRPNAVAKRHAKGLRTARENVEHLCDPDSFQEYGQLIVAAQRRIRPMDDLIDNTPADGLVAGFGTVNAATFGAAASRCAVLAYDYTVLAGTQGMFNHKKTDRVLELAAHWNTPVAFFCEGGGGRPSDTDLQEIVASTLDVQTFATYARGSGGAVRIGIASGPCFAGNAVLFGSSDVTIATQHAFIGMAGPAMIEAAGLGACRVQDIGPTEIQAANGVVDIVATDEADAVRLTQRVLSYFQGPTAEWTCVDQRVLRHAIPEDRKRVYAVRPLIQQLVDDGSFLELRAAYGVGMITGLARIEGRPIGLFANDPQVLGGAIDAEGAEKAARFMQLCDGFGIPLLSLCDTPGFMVGPEHERAATVRRASRMLVIAAHLQVPCVMVCLRKGYGLGAQAMAGGSFWSPVLNVSWPSGEFGPMGLEGAVELAFRKQLDAAPTPEARRALFDREVGRLYEAGKALSTASMLEIDAVIDPADTRQVVLRALTTFKAPPPTRPRYVDVW